MHCMNTGMTYQTKSTSSEDTSRIGEKLGAKCKGGEIFLLSSDLGGGKTTLSKGIAKGLSSQDVVSSPTFTVSNVYDAKNDIKVYHFDFYRLQEGGVVEQELRELSEDPKVVILIEWGDIIDESLPADMIRISIDRVSSGEDNRQVIVDIPDKYKYLWGLL